MDSNELALPESRAALLPEGGGTALRPPPSSASSPSLSTVPSGVTPAWSASTDRDNRLGTNFPPPNSSSDLSGVVSKVVSDNHGYVVEAALPWPASTGPQSSISANVSVNDDSSGDGNREQYITQDQTNDYWKSAAALPTVKLTP